MKGLDNFQSPIYIAMKIKFKVWFLILSLNMIGWNAHGQLARGTRTDPITEQDTLRSISPFFYPATKKKKTPDVEGFIQRWLVLEPINKSIRSNIVFTDHYLKTEFDTTYFPNQFTVIPKDGERVSVGI